ncbi:MAG: hypothetical protein ACI9K5_000292 [Gammaproteobacteria bacterium]
MSWRVLFPWLFRWYLRQPVAWGLQAIMLLGLAANIQMTPMRWIQPEAVFQHQLQSWILPWLLVGFTLSWKAIQQLQPVAQRLPLREELGMKSAVLLSVTLGTCIPWLITAGVMVHEHALQHLAGVALAALILGFGPAMGVAIGKGPALLKAGGWLVMLASWAFWGIPGAVTPPHLLPTLLACAGFILVGLGWRKHQTQHH